MMYMNKILVFITGLFLLIPISSCQNKQKNSLEVDIKSYLNDFELVQENLRNSNIIKIKGPKAIIDPSTNDIEIVDSTIQIFNKKSDDFQIKSGYSKLNNSLNVLNSYNDVYISLINKDKHFIKTNHLNLDLNTSIINFDSSLDINFDNTNIISSNGTYNINSSLFKINNNIFNRSIFTIDGQEKYQIQIVSDFASFLKKDNSLVFTSNNKQVETRINFLSTD